MEWIRSINHPGLYEDLRKLGMALMVGGVIGGIVDSDQISGLEGFILFWAGTFAWVIGLNFGAPHSEH